MQSNTENIYPIKCLNPQSIVNPYTNERLLVECGKCKACRVKKGSIASMKCKLESMSHAYTMFITLTYNRFSVPLMGVQRVHIENYDSLDGQTVSYIPRSESDMLVNYTPRLGVGTIVGRCNSSEKFLNTLRDKTNNGRFFPYLSKRDAQLFIKRLRKNISKYETEKIRYYCVGEYGPRHYRPHLHILLWFDSAKIYKNIRESIHKSWSYGRIDVETSKGQCADYVAKYVNGHCSLPRIYQEKETKPFALHSIHLGEMVLKKNREEVYSTPAADFVTRSVEISGKVTDVRLWRSLKAFYFPRCKNYALRNESERLYAYRLFCEASRIFDSNNLVYLTDCILSEIHAYNLFTEFPEYHDFDKSKENLVRYFMSSCQINAFDLLLRESYNKYARKVYMELRLSRHFIDFICESIESQVYKYYKKIENFWKEVDFLNLVNQYQTMEAFCETWYSDEEDLQYFFANVPHDLELYKTKPFFHRLEFSVNNQYENSVKHKKLNDMNDIFADK